MRILAALISFIVAAAALVLPLALPDGSWGSTQELVVVALVCAVVVALLPRVSPDATPLTSTVIAALSAGGSLAVLAVASVSRPFQYWVLVPAVATLIAFLAQLLRGTGASARTDSLASTISTALLGASGAGWYAAYRADAADLGLLVAVIGAVIGTAVSIFLAARSAGGADVPDVSGAPGATVAARAGVASRWVLGGAAGMLAAGAPVALVITVLQDRLS